MKPLKLLVVVLILGSLCFVVGTDGKIDRVALRFLQQTMGQQSVSLVAQVWQDPRVPAAQKEPLARVALSYVGLDPQANQLYQNAINDPNLSPDARQNLIEDLNDTGFADPRHLTPNDLALIENRISLIEQSAPTSMDAANTRGFQEAYKDLQHMRDSLRAKPAVAQ